MQRPSPIVAALCSAALLATVCAEPAGLPGLEKDDECETSDACALSALQLRHKASAVTQGLAKSSKLRRMRSKARSKFVTGNWSADQKAFVYSYISDTELLYTWTSGTESLNVTNTEAMKWAGPLTFLQALQSCSQGSLASAISHARQRGKLTLHLIGVGGALEPMMDWDHFLVGPLSQREELVVKTFGLQPTPFAGMQVSLTFNEFEDSKHVARKSMFPPGYSEGFVFGKYHEVVKDVPDIVLAINPGFAHYPTSWWPTLHHLATKQVPVVASGYGETMQSVIEYFPSVAGLLESSDHVRLPEGRVNHTYPFAILRGPGGGALSIPSKTDVWDYVNTAGQLAYRRHVFAAPTGHENGIFVNLCNRPATSLVAQDSEDISEAGLDDGGICSDLNGTIFLGRQAGYKVQYSARSAFQYCDHIPFDAECDANGVIALLEPNPQATTSAPGTPPANLFGETMMKALGCSLLTHQELTECVQRLLLAGPQGDNETKLGGPFDNMDEFFNFARNRCAGHDIMDDNIEGLIKITPEREDVIRADFKHI